MDDATPLALQWHSKEKKKNSLKQVALGIGDKAVSILLPSPPSLCINYLYVSLKILKQKTSFGNNFSRCGMFECGMIMNLRG